MRAVLTALGLLLVASPAFAASDPVAVLPFRNLNQNPDSEWMSRGIAETLISDIRKQGGLAVVERDQIDRALDEIAFQATKDVDVTTATRLGRIVGARTVVVGGYQQAGDQLRITARFVAVETGVVEDTAKATGKITEIFRLQDELVTRLLGKPVRKDRPERTTPSAPEKRVEAYRLYAMSLQAATDANRARLLHKALEVDPTFVYAADDLAALERRLEDYRERAESALSAQEKKVRGLFENPDADPNERLGAANQLFSNYSQSGRYTAMIALATDVYETDWPDGIGYDPRAVSLFWIFTAHMQLKQPDQALQVGEQYLKEFPASSYYPSVEQMMRQIIDQRHQRADAAHEVEEALDDLDYDRADTLLDRCELYHDRTAWSEAIEDCAAFVKRFESESSPKIQKLVARARVWQMQSLVESGRFDEARSVAEELLEHHPEEAERRAIARRMADWPLDEIPAPPEPMKPQRPKRAILVLPFVPTETDSYSLEYLDVGLARILCEDIRRHSKRDSIDWPATREVLSGRGRREQRIADASVARELGKQAGARQVLIGSYEIDGLSWLRVEARLIDVRNGRVEATAQVEGTPGDTLHVTDAVLSQLLGKDYAAASRPEIAGPDAADHARLVRSFARSLNDFASSYRTLVKLAIEHPDFYYATTEVDRRRRRIQALASTAAQSEGKQRAALLGYLESDSPQQSVRDRLWDLWQLLEVSGYERAAIPLGRTMTTALWPADIQAEVRDMGYYWQVLAQLQVQNVAAARKVADAYRKERPRGHWHSVIRSRVSAAEKKATQNEKKRAALPERLERISTSLANVDQRRCSTLQQHYQYLQARTECSAFVEKYREREGLEDVVLRTRWDLARINYELGEFDRAREIAEELIENEPEMARRFSIRTVIARWPR